jgi:hypothetical protein
MGFAGLFDIWLMRIDEYLSQDSPVYIFFSQSPELLMLLVMTMRFGWIVSLLGMYALKKQIGESPITKQFAWAAYIFMIILAVMSYLSFV